MATIGELIPNQVWQQTGENPYFHNHFWAHANDTLNKMENLKEEQFCSDDVSYLIKTLERYYKAIIELAHENYDSYTMPYNPQKEKYMVDYSHNLNALRTEIKKNFPTCFPKISQSDDKILSNKLREYSALYYDSSYYIFKGYDTFQEVLSFTKQERQYMEQFLNSEPFKGKEDYDDI